MARYSTGDPKTGLPARKALYGRTEQEARAKLIDALAARARGEPPFRWGRAPALEEHVKVWLQTCDVRPKTLVRYRELVELHVLPTLGRFQLDRLEPQHVEALLRMKRAAGLSSRTCNHVRTTLRTCLNDALRQGLVTRNVAALARPIKQDDRRESIILTPDQISSFIRIARRHPDGPLWLVALATGARESELLGLRWSDVDLEARVVRISKTLQRTPRPLREQHGEWIEQPTKTRRSTRAIPLARIASDELRRLRDLPSKTISGGRSPGLRDRLVFCRADGRPISGNHLSRSLQRALSDADLPRFDSTICDTRRRHFSRSRGSLSPSPWPSLATRTPARPLTSIRGWLPNWLARRQRQWTGSWLGDRSPIVRDRVNINQTARMRMK